MGEVGEVARKAHVAARSRIIPVRWLFLIGCTIQILSCPLPLAKGQEAGFGMNGREWARLSTLPSGGREAKMCTVRGIYDGLWMSRGLEKGHYCTQETYEHQVKALDDFYTDGRNHKIPVVNALQVVCYEIKGEPEAGIENLLEFLRKHYHGR